MKILAIHDGHDASTALLIDGEIVAAIQKERFSGLKGDYGFCRKSVDYCMSAGNIGASDLDLVAIASHTTNPVLMKIKRNANFRVSDWVEEQQRYWKYKLGLEPDIQATMQNIFCNTDTGDDNLIVNKKVNYYDIYKDKKHFKYDDFYPMDWLLDTYQDADTMELMKDIRKHSIAKELDIDPNKIVFVTHEDCHTAYAYYGSYLNGGQVICLTSEGIGDYSNATFSIHDEFGKRELASTLECHLGHIYQYITLLLGMKPAQHEYKVMGLAPYASEWEREKSFKVFQNILSIGKDAMPEYYEKPRDLYFHFKEALEGHRFDGVAAGLQMFTENILCRWLNKIYELMFDKGDLKKVRGLIFSGGVAQNVKANMAMANTYYARFPILTDFAVLPAAGDTSLSIGACFHANQESKGVVNKPIKNFYLGVDVNEETAKFDDYTIDMGCYWEKYNIYSHGDWNSSYIATLLSEGYVIARCSGRMEFGHRALGNRSILADPRDVRIVKKINSAIKRRDFWMPFAPVILREHAKYYLVPNQCRTEDRFMTMAYHTTELAQELIPAAIHPADFTCRPQILDREDNPEYYDIIDSFYNITGVPVLLNTSFNLHGEPICLGAKEALNTFENSELDFLILGDYLIGKKKE